MTLSGMFHVGIVVKDLQAAREHFTQVLGTTWGPIMESPLSIRGADGTDSETVVRLSYSTVAPYLELVEEREGSPWVCNEFSNLHHIGFFSDSLDADAGHLSGAGCPLEVCGRAGEDAPAGWTYSRDPLGVRLELIDAAMRPQMEEYNFKPAT